MSRETRPEPPVPGLKPDYAGFVFSFRSAGGRGAFGGPTRLLVMYCWPIANRLLENQ